MISVIIPAYNCSKTIQETVMSVVNGNSNVVSEIIIVDDKSSDNTLEIISGLESQYEIIKVYKNLSNLGGAETRNKAVSYSSCKHIFCLDSDNVLIPNSLSLLYNAICKLECDIVSFREILFFKGSRFQATHKWVFPIGYFKLEDYLSGTIVPGASGNYLFKRSAFDFVGGYRKGSAALDSWVFGLDVLASGLKMYVIDSGYYWHRYGTNSYWVRESKSNQISELAFRLLERHFGLIQDSSIRYLKLNKEKWFDVIDDKPIIVNSCERGKAGILVILSIWLKIRTLIFNYLKKVLK